MENTLEFERALTNRVRLSERANEEQAYEAKHGPKATKPTDREDECDFERNT